MKRRDVYRYAEGSAIFVIAHAAWQKSRGRGPSLTYQGERNPDRALNLAKQDALSEAREFVNAAADAVSDLIEANSANDNIDTSFIVFVDNHEAGRYPTFGQALEHFNDKILNIVRKQGGASRTWLEGANYMTHTARTIAGPVECLLDYELITELALTLGLTKDGILIKPLPRPVRSPLFIEAFIMTRELVNRRAVVKEFESERGLKGGNKYIGFALAYNAVKV
jgi:hypothetical protein